MCRTRARAELDTDRMLNLAFVRLIEIVGGAANRVSKQSQDTHPKIPWRKVEGMRNRIIHSYDGVDFQILWDTIHIDLPPLIEKLTATLRRR